MNVVSVSGGKDSTALYLLALERGQPFRAVFADTGHEHPLTYEYVRTLSQRTAGPAVEEVRADFTADFARKRQFVLNNWPMDGVPARQVARAARVLERPTGNPFLDLCILKGRFPGSRSRFCTEELKVIPITEQIIRPIIVAGKMPVSWQGVRAEESAARAMLQTFQRITVAELEYLAYRPLLRWQLADVWAMHARHGIKPNPLYDQGMGRVGCMPCIMCRKDELREIARRFPEEVARLEEWERIVGDASKRGGGTATFFCASDDPLYDESNPVTHEKYGIRARVEWSKTSRGGRQFSMFGRDALTACSEWGTCE